MDDPKLLIHEAMKRPDAAIPLANALRSVVELHEPREYVKPGIWQCGHCADNCHSWSGTGCEDPVDAEWPCETIQGVIEWLQA